MALARNEKNQVSGFYGYDPITGIFSLTKHVKPEHQLQKPPSWAIDEAIIKELRRRADEYDELDPLIIINIYKPDGTERIQSALSVFLKHAFPLNRNHGPQLALLLQWWHKDNAIQGSLL